MKERYFPYLMGIFVFFGTLLPVILTVQMSSLALLIAGSFGAGTSLILLIKQLDDEYCKVGFSAIKTGNRGKKKIDKLIKFIQNY